MSHFPLKANLIHCVIAFRFSVIFSALQSHHAIANNLSTTCGSKRCLKTFAGFPPTML
ncbi:Uncharacterised protein [Vibrio cholerae]|nr:Uncharacterised protein [Vibrio cholerae]CSD29613.1 Uncharacterised protein [Vibrio cholerae]CSD62143.1 Uncharacterised protein [Vibrio cholerae]